ncbi:LOW QUALITY PROTEIN: Retroelement pol Polyprotein [Phytophthora megakarya]|uniref:Retroelement pol Polyprotein n=1 Tax=Phytophthora megakarya TaxID=4795 RepID=A0A225VR66_9STRA|nr:LOW QUALITY PROTEIN: Retroelement pol Polyprotein [Phytophthora megakarya]
MTSTGATKLFERLTINATGLREKVNAKTNGRFHQLLLKRGNVNRTPVSVLLDSGADHNVIRKGLATNVLRRKSVVAERFDVLPMHHKWDLPTSHDVILGKPWFSRCNPNMDWRTREVPLNFDLWGSYWLDNEDERLFVMVEKAEAERQTVNGVEWLKDSTPENKDDWKSGETGVDRVSSAVRDATMYLLTTVKHLLKDYADCFPTELPNELSLSRPVEFLLAMKADAHPSLRSLFRLSKTEQDALQLFLLQKRWIEVSDSPWVSSTFSVPKKDHVAGKSPSRSDWICSGNASLPVRWVFDYLYVNSQTDVPKIPLPRIEELFDRMVGCCLFSIIDLAQGYHQMRVDLGNREYTAFRTANETYHWCVAPMGLSGMPDVLW